MSDWRSNTRNGKSSFMPLLDEINERLSLGETVKMIYDSFNENESIDIGYPQFTRYVKRYCKDSKPLKNKVKKTSSTEENEIDNEQPKNLQDVDDYTLYFEACFRNERITQRAINGSVPLKELLSWKAPNATRLGTMITNYTQHNKD